MKGIVFFCMFAVPLFGQTTDSMKVRVSSKARGVHIGRVKKEALNNALKQAVEKLGMEVRSTEFFTQKETKRKMFDSYSMTTESEVLGEIISYRVLKEDAKILDARDIQVILDVEAIVAKSKGERDPSFQVELKMSKEIYAEGEPMEFSIKSTKNGYLTILMGSEKGYYVLFPNSLETGNMIEENKLYSFPPPKNNYMQLKASIDGTDEEDETLVLVVVTKHEIPLTSIPKLHLESQKLEITEITQKEFSRWKLGIPLNQREQDEQLITVKREKKHRERYEYEER